MTKNYFSVTKSYLGSIYLFLFVVVFPHMKMYNADFYLLPGETPETSATPVQPGFGDHRFPGPRDPHPVRFQVPSVEGQHPSRFPVGPIEGQQAWMQQQQQQQQQRFPIETVGPRLPAPGQSGEIRFQGPPGTFPPQPPAQTVPQTVAQGRSKIKHTHTLLIYLFGKGLLFADTVFLGQSLTAFCFFVRIRFNY